MDWKDLPQINVPDDVMGPTKKFRRQNIVLSCQGQRRGIGKLLLGPDGSLYFFPKWKSAVVEIGNAIQKDGKLIKGAPQDISSLSLEDRTRIHLSLHPSGQVHIKSSNRKELTVAQIGPWLPVKQSFTFAYIYTAPVGMLPEVQTSGPTTKFDDPEKSLRLEIIICPLNEKDGHVHVPFHQSTIFVGFSPRYAVLLNATAIPPCESQFFFLSAYQDQQLLDRWMLLMDVLRLSAGRQELLAAGQEVIGMYSLDPVRTYHNVGHLVACLSKFEEVRDQAGNSGALAAALWFHDAVYVPGEAGNEARSAELAVEMLERLGMDSAGAKEVARLIKATSHQDEPESDNEKLICDIDLAILGKSWTEYSRYAAAVDREYSMAANQFAAGRAEFLRTMLTRKRIYHTDHFHSRLEQTARDNMQRELAELEK